ncbi:MAG: NAD-dependent dehydratase [Bdellovibrionales bacterium]
MKILIIGGNRFFGKKLTNNLLNQGHEITLLTRGQRLDDFNNLVNRIHFNRKELKEQHPILGNQKWNLVFDQVCYDSFEAEGACQTFSGRTQQYVFTSSQSVYGPGEAIKETAFEPAAYSFGKAITRDVDYGEAKRQAEATFFKTADFPIASVRFPIVLGEDDHDRRLHFHVRAILENKPIYFPNLEAKISFISSYDAAGFLASFSETFNPGPINCCSTEPIALKEFIEVLEEVLGKKANVVSDPKLGETSPFGIGKDWYMNTQNLSQFAYQPSPIQKWLPDMVRQIARE